MTTVTAARNNLRRATRCLEMIDQQAKLAFPEEEWESRWLPEAYSFPPVAHTTVPPEYSEQVTLPR